MSGPATDGATARDPSSRAIAIRAEGLEKYFGPVPALRGVDFEVSPGEAIAVLGPNGAGKSTLLHLLAGLSRPTRGTLEVSGASKDRRRARSAIGLIGHETYLYPNLSALENLVFAGKLYGLSNPEARAAQLLHEQKLDHAAHRPVKQFSRGMAQRVSIARGLIHDPPILLLDEPFTGLDHSSATLLSERLRTLRDAGKAVVMVSHDLPRTAEVASKAIVLLRGLIVHRCSVSPLELAQLERAYREAVDPDVLGGQP